uniref:AP2/ERF domain-containing protein n=1 Tax=Chromera velia CCMP2878 TaxID=1169474 RepID=A0A0G4GM61_9ALVE|eukprot:Cvel_22484.t1-p1 / transcript=Cvel_22484.t1 / gene=Cvel_22484 / organism=Chromera_velia_CCMP2878 / gene_product=hypothetical protein / transcript_product=hypothetical protein / location=Cvel_scaffold2214:25891-29985(-) / protein_length=1226 / sequence_SO=supercontig / SO=protein_coding / is_pseudo=false
MADTEGLPLPSSVAAPTAVDQRASSAIEKRAEMSQVEDSTRLVQTKKEEEEDVKSSGSSLRSVAGLCGEEEEEDVKMESEETGRDESSQMDSEEEEEEEGEGDGETMEEPAARPLRRRSAQSYRRLHEVGLDASPGGVDTDNAPPHASASSSSGVPVLSVRGVDKRSRKGKGTGSKCSSRRVSLSPATAPAGSPGMPPGTRWDGLPTNLTSFHSGVKGVVFSFPARKWMTFWQTPEEASHPSSSSRHIALFDVRQNGFSFARDQSIRWKQAPERLPAAGGPALYKHGVPGLCWNTKEKAWVAYWREGDNRKRQKMFSSRGHGGSDEARVCAMEYRQMMETHFAQQVLQREFLAQMTPLEPDDEIHLNDTKLMQSASASAAAASDAPVDLLPASGNCSCDRTREAFRALLSLREAGGDSGPYSERRDCGFPGVDWQFVEASGSGVWMVRWLDGEGTVRKGKAFDPLIFGEFFALKLAFEWRDAVDRAELTGTPSCQCSRHSPGMSAASGGTGTTVASLGEAAATDENGMGGSARGTPFIPACRGLLVTRVPAGGPSPLLPWRTTSNASTVTIPPSAPPPPVAIATSVGTPAGDFSIPSPESAAAAPPGGSVVPTSEPGVYWDGRRYFAAVVFHGNGVRVEKGFPQKKHGHDKAKKLAAQWRRAQVDLGALDAGDAFLDGEVGETSSVAGTAPGVTGASPGLVGLGAGSQRGDGGMGSASSGFRASPLSPTYMAAVPPLSLPISAADPHNTLSIPAAAAASGSLSSHRDVATATAAAASSSGGAAEPEGETIPRGVHYEQARATWVSSWLECDGVAVTPAEAPLYAAAAQASRGVGPVMRRKTWSVHRYGETEARRLAFAFRRDFENGCLDAKWRGADGQMLHCPRSEAHLYSSDSGEGQAAASAGGGSQEKPKSGVPGVNWDSAHRAWRAYVRLPTGFSKSCSFRVDVYGHKEALRLAATWRQKTLQGQQRRHHQPSGSQAASLMARLSPLSQAAAGPQRGVKRPMEDPQASSSGHSAAAASSSASGLGKILQGGSDPMAANASRLLKSPPSPNGLRPLKSLVNREPGGREGTRSATRRLSASGGTTVVAMASSGYEMHPRADSASVGVGGERGKRGKSEEGEERWGAQGGSDEEMGLGCVKEEGEEEKVCPPPMKKSKQTKEEEEEEEEEQMLLAEEEEVDEEMKRDRSSSEDMAVDAQGGGESVGVDREREKGTLEEGEVDEEMT